LIAEMGTLYRGHFALEAASRLAAALEDWEAAARLQGASDAAVDAVGGTRTWFDDAVLRSLFERPRAILGERGYVAAYEQGRRSPLADALGEAGAWLAPDALRAGTTASTGTARTASPAP
jgi:hypothetical protein